MAKHKHEEHPEDVEVKETVETAEQAESASPEKSELELANELADDFQTQVVGTLSHSGLVTEAEEKKETVMECFPDSEMAEEYRKLAEAIYELSKRPEGSACEKADEKYTADKRPGEGLKC